MKPCTRNQIADFIEQWHYSQNINGVVSDYCFSLLDGSTLIGAMIYGKIAMADVWKKYADNESDLIELRRLCCIDDTPKNTESYFIGQTLRWLKQNTDIKRVISYADTTYGHEGTIYKATNFKHCGMTNTGRVIIYDGSLEDSDQLTMFDNPKKNKTHRYHDKTIRTGYKNRLKPFAQKIKKALETGNAWYENTSGKHIYLYDLKRKTAILPKKQQFSLFFDN